MLPYLALVPLQRKSNALSRWWWPFSYSAPCFRKMFKPRISGIYLTSVSYKNHENILIVNEIFCLLLQLGCKIISWNPTTLTEFWKNFNRVVRTKEKRQVGLSVVIYDWSIYFPVKTPRGSKGFERNLSRNRLRNTSQKDSYAKLATWQNVMSETTTWKTFNLTFLAQ